MNDVVSHEEQGQRGTFFIERNGLRIAEMTYRHSGENRIVIDHTEVEPQLRGQGIARLLLDAAVAWARQNSTEVGATCSYAVAQFARDASIRDVAG